MACVLRVIGASIDMLRAAVLSIVLTLAGGQNATLICRVWCGPVEGTAQSCQHEDPIGSVRMTAGLVCVNAPGVAAVREDTRRAPSAVHADLASPPAARTARASEGRPSRESGQTTSLAQPPLVALRI
jgi:hypothetical protein